jgi:hypothetical protein
VSGTESSPLPDPDDWFAESEWAGGSSPAGAAADAERGEPRRPFSDFTVTLRTLLLVAAVVVVGGVVIALAVAGVFSGSSHPRTTSPPATTRTTPKQTTTPTTTAARTPRVVAPTAPLKPGDTGTQVKRLQRALAELGYKPGSVDGDYGPSTVEAVKRFQAASKLTADGVVGPATLRAIRRALG